MKNVKKLFIPLLGLGVFLTSCSLPGPLDAFTEMQPLSYTVDTVEDIDIPEEAEDDSSEKEFVIFNAEDISFAFNEAVLLEGYSFFVEYYETAQFTGWWMEIIEATERENSRDMAAFLTSFLPDYTYVWMSGYVDVYGSRNDEYGIISVNPNISSAVEVYSYLDSDNLNAEIYIYDIY